MVEVGTTTAQMAYDLASFKSREAEESEREVIHLTSEERGELLQIENDIMQAARKGLFELELASLSWVVGLVLVENGFTVCLHTDAPGINISWK